MDNQEITCIVCPLGCKIKVKNDGTQCEIIDGNRCKKGIEYAKTEALDPRRVITSSILVTCGEWPLVSVKTTKPIQKNSLTLVLDEIKKALVTAPVTIGDVLIRNVGNTGSDVVATKNVRKEK